MLSRHIATFVNTLFVSLVFLFITGTLQANPLPPEDVPEPLKPWIEWALHDEKGLDCPWQYNQQQRACSWPSRLNLDLNDQGGTFSQQWQTYDNTFVRLPGDGNNWPQEVSNETGEKLLVEEREGFPVVKLSRGIHTINGSFHWNRLPKALRVTPESGLISLSVNDKTIARPNFNQQGQLWLTQGKTQTASEDNLDIQVFRKILDSHPIQVITSIRLRVSGKQRNATLSPVLLDGFIPLQLDSPLPARIAEKQQLQVQLRPGEWTLQVTGRAASDQTTFTLPASEAPWPQQEVWVLQTDSAMRQVEASGVNSIDPNQTRLPTDWKSLPAYLMAPGQTLTLDVIQRGAAQTGKKNLSLRREMWLDFSGAGYTVKDQLSGNIRQQSRLNVLPELALGRVSVGGQPQFITRESEDAPPGVELRSEQLNLTAESRYQGQITSPPVNGWQQDLQRVDTQLHLPPGWRLFSVSGTDNHPQSWVQRWSLLDLFLVLVIALGTGYLFGWLWGGLALLTLVFIWHEPNAPRFIWLNLLAATALLRVLPAGWLKRSVTTYRWLSLLTLAIIALPYMIDTVRIGLYPQLAHQHRAEAMRDSSIATFNNFAADTAAEVAEEQNMAEPVMQQTPMSMSNSGQQMGKSLRKPAPKPAPRPVNKVKKTKYDMKAIDPNSMIQTGPGLPHWRSYRTINLHWAGPVKADERTYLWLINPQQNLLLKLAGIMLLLALSWRMLSQSQGFSWPPGRRNGGGTKHRTGAQNSNNADETNPDTRTVTSQQNTGAIKQTLKLLPLFLLPVLLFTQQPAQATSIPDQQTLQTLRERLTDAPDCLPVCAQIERMQVTLGGNTLNARLTVHASVDTAIPLPGSQDTWLAKEIRLNYQNAQAIGRDQQQQLWLAIPAGQHEIQLRGPLPKRNQITLPLPLKPHQVSWQSMSKDWTLEGIRDNGTPEAQLQLNRILNEDEKAQQEQQQSILPTFVKIERHLHLGLDWHVETTVRRISPPDTPLSLSIPLLPNEQPMSERLRIRNQQIKINLGAEQMTARWSSRLTPGDEIILKASNNPDYLESWHLATSPVWNVKDSGLPVNQFTQPDGQRVPVWLPWPGEKLTLAVSRPQGVPGQTVTLLGSQLSIQTGKRANDITLNLSIRSSRGVQHQIELPADADLQELSIDGIPQRIQRNDNKLSLTLKPGQQSVNVLWREHKPQGLSYQFPAVDPGLPGVNTRLQINPLQDRWILWTQGPTLGPAVLFWGVLLALLIVSLALGYSRLTPVKSWQWFLLGIGLSQTEPLLMILVAGWLIAIALRGKITMPTKWWQFNLLQLALAGLTLLALLILAVALSHGLLGQPEMQIAGNGSGTYSLKWYQDLSTGTLPQPLLVSVPLWVYRVLMLAWALWLAVSVLRWLGWSWQALNHGNLWLARPTKPEKAQQPGTAISESNQEANTEQTAK
ncbi:MAG: hypothetical protein ACPGVP_13545 [Thiolinea sp.]